MAAVGIEFDRFRKIDFGDDRDVGGAEDGGIFQGFVLAFGDRERRTRRRSSPKS